MAQEVFARIEKKFLLRPEQYKALRAVFDEKMAQDAYGRHTILNIYLDTPDYELTRESIEKPIYKEKVRLRAYGMPKEDDKVFLEIKKKYKGVVYKRRADDAPSGAGIFKRGREAAAGLPDSAGDRLHAEVPRHSPDGLPVL